MAQKPPPPQIPRRLTREEIESTETFLRFAFGDPKEEAEKKRKADPRDFDNPPHLPRKITIPKF